MSSRAGRGDLFRPLSLTSGKSADARQSPDLFALPQGDDGAHWRAVRADGCRRKAAERSVHGGTAFRHSRDDHGGRHAAGRGHDGHDAETQGDRLLRHRLRRRRSCRRGPARNRGRPQSGGECLRGGRSRRHPDAGGDAAAAAGGQLCPERKLGGGKTFAADASAGRQSRPPRRRLRHGRDRPQDRGPRRGLRDRRRPISAAAGTTCRINICRAWRRWRNGAAC